MANYCNACHLVFDRHYANCPQCGSMLQADDRTIQQLQSAGYKLMEIRRTRASAHAQPTNTNTVDDPLQHLRTAYGSADFQAAPSDVQHQSESLRTSAADWLRSSGGQTGSAQSGQSTTQPQYQRTTGMADKSTTDPAADELREYQRQLDAERRRQRRLERAYRMQDALSHFPWGVVMRIIGILGAILLGIWLINIVIAALPLLLNSVLEVVLSCLPIVLVLAGIFLMIKSVFR